MGSKPGTTTLYSAIYCIDNELSGSVSIKSEMFGNVLRHNKEAMGKILESDKTGLLKHLLIREPFYPFAECDEFDLAEVINKMLRFEDGTKAMGCLLKMIEMWNDELDMFGFGLENIKLALNLFSKVPFKYMARNVDNLPNCFEFSEKYCRAGMFAA